MDWSNRFSLGGFIVSYSTLHQMWEVITEKDGIEVSYRWFGTKAKAEAFAMKKTCHSRGSQHESCGTDCQPTEDKWWKVIQ